MKDISEIIVLLGTFGVAILLSWFGFKLMTTGTKQEKTIIKLGSFELTLSTLVGGILILGAVFVVYTLLKGYYK